MTARAARSGHRPSVGPSLSGLVTDMLGRLAHQHRPDRVRILHRMGVGPLGPAVGDPPCVRRAESHLPGWTVPVAAVAVGVVLGLAIGPGDTPSDAPDPAVAAPAAPQPDPAGRSTGEDVVVRPVTNPMIEDVPAAATRPDPAARTGPAARPDPAAPSDPARTGAPAGPDEPPAPAPVPAARPAPDRDDDRRGRSDDRDDDQGGDRVDDRDDRRRGDGPDRTGDGPRR